MSLLQEIEQFGLADCKQNEKYKPKDLRMNFHLTLKSSNKKTGEIPVSTSSSKTCPSICPFNNSNGCYANGGPLALHWKKISDGLRGEPFIDFLLKIKSLPEGQLWRHNQAGDLMGDGNRINAKMLTALVSANKGKKGFTYTHYDPSIFGNAKKIENANKKGFTINLSSNNSFHADQLVDLNIAPVVTVLPSEQKNNCFTEKGRLIVVCPATIRENIDCKKCQLCAIPNRKFIIGFPLHGTQKKKASRVFEIKPIFTEDDKISYIKKINQKMRESV
jgi:hypothetical protein